ncbi:hypothetical protein NQ176_g11101 [Zarea fungicola]|uniref:Uncharacterized protein n=1 Tax=Zarea fungicola TaxID=93591 RepID=A0ACC1MD45_9HYPO|nr:hypothetical protein NQ176_g11101 [Lecanicillium fungicola]
MTDTKSEAATANTSQSPSRTDDAQQRRPSHLDVTATSTRTGDSTGASTPAVRFSSAVEEISHTESPTRNGTDATPADELQEEVTPEQLKAFTKSLHGPLLQERRLNTYQFEAFSLPPSRVSRQFIFFILVAIGIAGRLAAPRCYARQSLRLIRFRPHRPRDNNANTTTSL